MRHPVQTRGRLNNVTSQDGGGLAAGAQFYSAARPSVWQTVDRKHANTSTDIYRWHVDRTCGLGLHNYSVRHNRLRQMKHGYRSHCLRFISGGAGKKKSWDRTITVPKATLCRGATVRAGRALTEGRHRRSFRWPVKAFPFIENMGRRNL